MLEKYDRSQNEIYRVQSRSDTFEADRNRLEVEVDRHAQLATKAREDLRKLQEESGRLQEACDRIALQLQRAKENEEKTREELEIQRERSEKAQTDVRRMQSEKEILQAEFERVSYELERASHTHAKSNAALDAAQEEAARCSLELDKMRERYEKSQTELRRLQEQEAYSRDSRRTKEENERLRDRLDKTLMELEGLKGKAQYDQDTYEKFKEKYEQRENEVQISEVKLHECTLQLELSKGEVAKLIANQVSVFCAPRASSYNIVHRIPTHTGEATQRTGTRSHRMRESSRQARETHQAGGTNAPESRQWRRCRQPPSCDVHGNDPVGGKRAKRHQSGRRRGGESVG